MSSKELKLEKQIDQKGENNMKRQMNNIESSNLNSKFVFCQMMGFSNMILIKQLNFNAKF